MCRLPAPAACLHFVSYMVSVNIALSASYGGENKCLLSLPCSRSDNTHRSGVYLQEYESCFVFHTGFPTCAFYYTRGKKKEKKVICSYPVVCRHTWNEGIMSFFVLILFFHLFPHSCEAVHNVFTLYIFVCWSSLYLHGFTRAAETFAFK